VLSLATWSPGEQPRGARGCSDLVPALPYADAQTSDPATSHTTHAVPAAPATSADVNVQQELARLRTQVQKLEQRAQSTSVANKQGSAGTPKANQSRTAVQGAPTGMRMGAMMNDDMTCR
jgi:hypothetical protein